MSRLKEPNFKVTTNNSEGISLNALNGGNISISATTGNIKLYGISGVTYGGNYSSNFNDRSLVDKGYVAGQITGVISNFNTYTGTTAPATYLPFTMATDQKDPTGFIDCDNIDIKYTYSARTITLTGDLDYYWRGVRKTLSSPWTSSAHTASVNHWYLYSTDGTNITWSNSAWNFDALQVVHLYYKSTSGATYGIRETHGLMPWSVHEDLHETIGTHLKSGGQVTTGSYTANTASNSAVSPSFNIAIVDDEDLETTIATLNKISGYTLMYVSATTSVYTLANTQPFLPNSNAFISVNNPSTGAMTAGISNRYYNVYQILVPTTSDVISQKYRMIFLAPQATYTTLAAAQAEDTRGLSIGSLSTESAEYVIYARITYFTANGNTNNGKVTIPIGGITYVIGNRMSSLSVAGVSSTNHANLSNLTWVDSGHVGTNNSFATFDSNGDAINILTNTISTTGHTHSQYLSGATNLGSGNGTIYTSILNNNIQLKSLSGGTNVTLTCNGNYITINASGGGTIISNNQEIIFNNNGILTGNTNLNYNYNIDALIINSFSQASGCHSVAMAGGAACGDNSVAMVNGVAYSGNSVAMVDGSAYGENLVAMAGGVGYGCYSVAMASGAACGENSVAMAGGTACGINSVAMVNGIAYSGNSVVMAGGETYGEYSVAMGNESCAFGLNSVAMAGGEAHGLNSVAMSNSGTLGENSVAMANGSTYSGNSVAMSYGTTYGLNSVAMIYSNTYGENSVAMVCGIACGLNSVAMAGGATYGCSSVAMAGGTACGCSSVAMAGSTACGLCSVAMAGGSFTYGECSVAMAMSYAYGLYSVAMASSYACGEVSVAMAGSIAYSGNSVAMAGGATYGYGSVAMAGGTTYGYCSVAMAVGCTYGSHSLVHGLNNINYSNNSAVIGGYNNFLYTGNTNSVLLGGNSISINADTLPDTVIVPNLAIYCTPSGNGFGDILNWDSNTKKVGLATDAHLGQNGWLYFGYSGETNSWRLGVSGATFIHQCWDGGSYITKQSI